MCRCFVTATLIQSCSCTCAINTFAHSPSSDWATFTFIGVNSDKEYLNVCTVTTTADHKPSSVLVCFSCGRSVCPTPRVDTREVSLGSRRSSWDRVSSLKSKYPPVMFHISRRLIDSSVGDCCCHVLFM